MIRAESEYPIISRTECCHVKKLSVFLFVCANTISSWHYVLRGRIHFFSGKQQRKVWTKQHILMSVIYGFHRHCVPCPSPFAISFEKAVTRWRKFSISTNKLFRISLRSKNFRVIIFEKINCEWAGNPRSNQSFIAHQNSRAPSTTIIY